MCFAQVSHIAILASHSNGVEEFSRVKRNWFVTYEARVLFLFLRSANNITGPDCTLVKDKILCFVCAVSNIERTFNTYYELQDHLYRDHDMKKDPAMDIFNKYRTTAVPDQPAASQS